MRCGLLGDTPCELLVFRAKSEEAHDGVFQFASVTVSVTLAGQSSKGTFGFSTFGGRFGAQLSFRNRLARRPQSEESAVLAMPASRLPRQPVGARSLDGPGQEGIARRQELPVSRNLNISVLGIPLTILGRVDVEMQGTQGFGIGRGLRIVHTQSLGRCDPLRKQRWTRVSEVRTVPAFWDITPTTGAECSLSAPSVLWEALARPTSKGAGHSEEATTTRGPDGDP